MFIDLTELYVSTEDNYYWISNNKDWDSLMMPFPRPKYIANNIDIWKAIYKSIDLKNNKVVYINNFCITNVNISLNTSV